MADPQSTLSVSITLNGKLVKAASPARESLADFIRHRIGLTGTNVGCEQGICGACTVRLDGKIARSCLTLAAQADGCDVETIEGLSASKEIADLQQAFYRNNAAQCGFCTPGMLISSAELLDRGVPLSREDIREFLSGNFCRCTGYQAIVDAVEEVSKERQHG